MEQSVTFPSGTVKYFYESAVSELWNKYDVKEIVFITDKHVASSHPHLFKEHKTIVLPAGESSKSLQTVEHVAKELLKLEATPLVYINRRGWRCYYRHNRFCGLGIYAEDSLWICAYHYIRHGGCRYRRQKWGKCRVAQEYKQAPSINPTLFFMIPAYCKPYLLKSGAMVLPK